MKGGFIYTPKDERDYPICMAYEDADDIEIPESYKTTYQPPYADQVSSNCVAQTIANIMEVMWHKVYGKHDDFSVGFVYGNRYKSERQYMGEGMTGYLAMGNVCKDGNVKSSVYDDPSEVPFIIEDVERFKQENPDWREKAFIPKSYIRTRSPEEVKKFIYMNDLPILAVCEVNDFWIGGGLHAMALYGYDGDTAIMQNSWGDTCKTVELRFKDIKEFWILLPYAVMDFTDVEDKHWAYNEIAKIVEEQIMLGYPDKTFRPDKEITRAEMAVMMYRILKGEKKI